MVIARPAGLDDVDFQMVARPLHERLQAVRGEVRLDVAGRRRSRHSRTG